MHAMRRWIGVVAGTLITVSVATPQAADAQTVQWNLACSTVGQPVGGGTVTFPTCISAQLSLFGGTTYDLRLWNRAGTNGTDPNGTITSVGLFGIGADNEASGLDVNRVNGTDYAGWSLTNNIPGPSNTGGFLVSGVTDGIISEAWTGGNIQGRERTLWSGNFNSGFVNFRFTTETGLDLTAPSLLTLDLHVQNVGPNGGQSTGYSCPPTDFSALCNPGGGGTGSVVPEPSTYLLLGSGLLGILGVVARRRRAA